MAEAEKTVIQCAREGCQAALTGVCSEGHHPLASCPNIGGDPDDRYDEPLDADADDREGSEVVRVDKIQLPTGQLLTPIDVDKFLRWRPATFISVVGDNFSGKTTLLCALYERFLKGHFAELSFVGSRTLVALEERSHHGRMESGRATPDTLRTSLAAGLRYFHVAVAPTGRPQKRVDLLLSDRAGEIYRQARGSSDVVATLEELPRANRVVVLLDGERIARPVDRAAALQSTRQMLRAFVDNGALNSTSNVQIVTTKLDLLMTLKEQAKVMEIIEDFRRRLASDFAPRLGKLTFWDISARDPQGKFEPAHGIDRLMSDWMLTENSNSSKAVRKLPIESEFDRLLTRTP